VIHAAKDVTEATLQQHGRGSRISESLQDGCTIKLDTASHTRFLHAIINLVAITHHVEITVEHQIVVVNV
jgi:hypothetical protein